MARLNGYLPAEVLSALGRLQRAGSIDADRTAAQLTLPATSGAILAESSQLARSGIGASPNRR